MQESGFVSYERWFLIFLMHQEQIRKSVRYDMRFLEVANKREQDKKKGTIPIIGLLSSFGQQASKRSSKQSLSLCLPRIAPGTYRGPNPPLLAPLAKRLHAPAHKFLEPVWAQNPQNHVQRLLLPLGERSTVGIRILQKRLSAAARG